MRWDCHPRLAFSDIWVKGQGFAWDSEAAVAEWLSGKTLDAGDKCANVALLRTAAAYPGDPATSFWGTGEGANELDPPRIRLDGTSGNAKLVACKTPISSPSDPEQLRPILERVVDAIVGAIGNAVDTAQASS